MHAELRARILEGELAPGSRLHQAELSAELGVSRTPLREALSRLAAEGLVEALPQRGARVAGIGVSDMEEAYRARLVIEPAAAAMAAAEPVPASLEEMERAIAEHRRNLDDAFAAFDANRAFHMALVEACGNQFLVRFAEMLWVGRLGRTIYLAQDEPPDFIRRDADEHAAIAAAIRTGDGERARRLTHDHILAALRLLQEVVASQAA